MDSQTARAASTSYANSEVPRHLAAHTIRLDLQVSDPDVVADLQRRSEGPERDEYALAALRLGILSLRVASGHVDTAVLREAGTKLLADVRDLLTTRATELTGALTGTFSQYLDPGRGTLPKRLDDLLAKGGELERCLQKHLGADESTLARTLTDHLGSDSPIFRLLSPNDTGGLKAQVAETIAAALAEQRKLVLREFSLDSKDSALSRLVAEIGATQEHLKRDLKGQVETVVQELSLDHPNSGLSRLVGRVEIAQKAIADQFSTDNELSALSKLSRLLESANAEIGKNLTLDDDRSALSRLRKELVSSIELMVEKNNEFQQEVRVTLAAVRARREEEGRSTRHGEVFEAQLGELLSVEAQRAGDRYTSTGSSAGSIRNCKIGDHVTQLGPESPAPGSRIVWEAKEDRTYALDDALEEIETARKNRGAGVGVFVFSVKTAPAGLQAFTRYGDDIVIVWDAESVVSDVYVKAAYSVGRALSIRAAAHSSRSDEALRTVDRAVRAIERQIQHLDQIKTWSDTVRGHGEKIGERVAKMKTELAAQVEELDRELRVLRDHSAAEIAG